MKTVIMAWAKQGFREFFLPGIHNADCQIQLGKKLFGLQEDLELKLEILDEVWRILPDDNYSFRNEWKPGSDVLEDESLYTLIPAHGDVRISLIIVKWKHARIGCRKYDISSLNSFSVGSSEENHITYAFQNYVSKVHAVFTRKNGRWIINDQSGNGTFVNGRRIQESQKLCFGDTIALFGLKLVFLGDILACSMAGGVMSQERLPLLKVPEPALRS